MPINFQNVINLAGQKGFAFSKQSFAGNIRCDNQYWGSINFNNKTHNMNRSPINRQQQTNTNILIIIGESPHTHEFNFLNNGNNGVTANGPMMKYNTKISGLSNQPHNLRNVPIPNSGVWDVYLLNAIPYQCSFWLKLRGNGNHKKQKEEVFSIAWNIEPCLDELIDEINKIIVFANKNYNVIIINSCTKSLKTLCNSSVLEYKLNFKYNVYDEYHISKW